MRKGYTQLTCKDFEEFPVWELQHSLTTVEPYKGKIPFEEDKFRVFFVRTNFVLADESKLTGWTMICVPPYDLHSLSPTILTDKGPVEFIRSLKQSNQKNLEEAFRRMGKPAKNIFPLRYRTDVQIPNGPASGEMAGFLYRLEFEDDRGWPQHEDFVYQKAEELESAIKRYNEIEAAKKPALEPSKEEKALFKAAKSGGATKVKSLLSKGANLNRGGTFENGGYTAKNVTALMLAAENGHAEILRILIEAGADIHVVADTNEPRAGGKTALAYACCAEQIEATGLLLKAGANPNHKLSFGHTIFDEVCYEKRVEIIQLLLDFGADPDASCGKSDFYFALERAIAGNRLDVVQMLLRHKASVNGSDSNGETALMAASKMLRWEIVKLLLNSGADVTLKTNRDETALHRAVLGAVRIDPKYDSNAKERTAWAMEIVKSLVEKGADIHASTKTGNTPFSMAKDCKFPELAEYLNGRS